MANLTVNAKKYGQITTQVEHVERLKTVLKRLQDAGVTLNEICEFSKRFVKFLGHIIDEQGIRPDPAKTEAIRNFPVPQKVNDLQRFMGMVNQMVKFIPNLANLNEPLRQLLRKENMWKWDKAQQQSFEGIKNELTSAINLAHYDPSRPTVISSDASNFGLGAVLLKRTVPGSWCTMHLDPSQKLRKGTQLLRKRPWP